MSFLYKQPAIKEQDASWPGVWEEQNAQAGGGGGGQGTGLGRGGRRVGEAIRAAVPTCGNGQSKGQSVCVNWIGVKSAVWLAGRRKRTLHTTTSCLHGKPCRLGRVTLKGVRKAYKSVHVHLNTHFKHTRELFGVAAWSITHAMWNANGNANRNQ